MPNLLDVDSSIFERNLLLKEFENNDEDVSADSLFNIKSKTPDDIPWKPVKPQPGYCLKLKTHEGDKVFVNVCHTDGIPEPEEISEEKLLQMIIDDDVPSFRIPISIGDLHIESDKSRNPCSVYDIAVNSKFFKKMETSEVFNTFFLNVSIQGLQEKYSLDLDLKSEKPFLLLKNRKVIGNLQIHRIQQREVKKAPGKLIQEINSKPSEKSKLIEVVTESQSSQTQAQLTQLQDKHIKSSSQSKKSEESKPILNNFNMNMPDRNTTKDVNSTASTPLKIEMLSPTSCEDSEKGIEENRFTKDNMECGMNTSQKRFDSGDYHMEDSGTVGAGKLREIGQGDVSQECSGLFCIKQYPEVGTPELLIASIRLNVKSSSDFDLELDTNRVSITTRRSSKPWFEFTLPYDIDVNKVEACFIAQSQRLMIKMDVVKT